MYDLKQCLVKYAKAFIAGIILASVILLIRNTNTGSEFEVTVKEFKFHQEMLAGPFASPKVASQESSSGFDTAIGSDCWNMRNVNSLSIHMVIVPFLQFNNVSTEKILAREAEYKYVLQKNLAHPLVQCVHVLTTNYTETLSRFKDLPNGQKLLIAEVKSVDFARDPFEYISHNLVGKDAMYANADVYLGEGFEVVDPAVMNRQKIIYALTRQVKPEERCGVNRTFSDTNMCLEQNYIGSHDVFLFHLNNTLPDDFLDTLDFRLDSSGLENVVIWLFQHNLRYCVLNPCSILELFHYHCSNVRSSTRQRVNHKLHMTGLSGYTKRLDCH